MKHLYVNRTHLVAVFCLALAVSCAPKSRTAVSAAQSPIGTPTPAAPVSPDVGAQPATDSNLTGTSSGGGGADILGKPIESYKKDFTDPKEFPEFNQLIAPLLKDVAKLYHQDIFGQVVNHILKNRSWYLLPVALNKIPSAKMGIPAAADQFGYQTAGAVWITSLQYKGSASDKANRLLHEILVGIKIIRHLSDFEQCRAMYGLGLGEMSSDEVCMRYDREPLRSAVKLSEDDYDQVRYVTNWLLENHGKMSAVEFARVMHNNRLVSHMFNFFERIPDQNPMSRNSEAYDGRMRDLKKAAQVPAHFYTDFDETTHIAKSYCQIYLSLAQDQSELSVTIQVKNKQTNELIKDRSVKIPIDNVQKLNFNSRGPTNPANPYSSYYFSGQNLTPPFIKGKKFDSVDIGFSWGEPEYVYSHNAYIEEVDQKCGDHFCGRSRGPRDEGMYCSMSEIQLPSEYYRWLDLPKADREQLEKRWFGGETVESLRRAGKYNVKVP